MATPCSNCRVDLFQYRLFVWHQWPFVPSVGAATAARLARRKELIAGRLRKRSVGLAGVVEWIRLGEAELGESKLEGLSMPIPARSSLVPDVTAFGPSPHTTVTIGRRPSATSSSLLIVSKHIWFCWIYSSALHTDDRPFFATPLANNPFQVSTFFWYLCKRITPQRSTCGTSKHPKRANSF